MRLALALPLLLAAASKPTAVESASGKKLLAQAIEGAGGAKAVGAIDDVMMQGTLTATMGEDDVAGTVLMTEARDGSTRDELTFGGYEMISVAGPSGGFTSQAGLSKTLSGNDLVQAQAQSRFTPLGLLIHGNEPGVVLRALPPEADHDVLEVDPPGADPLVFQLDQKTHLVTKLTTISGGATLVQRYGLYRDESGVKLPHQIVVVQAGLSMILSFKEIRINGGVAAATTTAIAVAKETPTASHDPLPEATSTPASNATHSVAVTNRSGKTLSNIYFSVHDKKEWGTTALAVDRFHDGDTATLHAAGDCVLDVMITDVDGHFWVVPGVSVCDRVLTLRSKKSGMTFDSK